MNRLAVLAALSAAAAAVSRPAAAEVTVKGDAGFVSHNEAEVAAAPAEAWAAMLRPGEWWSGDHTYSGDAANMTIAPTAGGCFCEAIPGADGAPAGQVEHMRVIFVAPGATLRLSGGLGPLQGEAVTGVLTMTLAPRARAPGSTGNTWSAAICACPRQSSLPWSIE